MAASISARPRWRFIESTVTGQDVPDRVKAAGASNVSNNYQNHSGTFQAGDLQSAGLVFGPNEIERRWEGILGK